MRVDCGMSRAYWVLSEAEQPGGGRPSSVCRLPSAAQPWCPPELRCSAGAGAWAWAGARGLLPGRKGLEGDIRATEVRCARPFLAGLGAGTDYRTPGLGAWASMRDAADGPRWQVASHSSACCLRVVWLEDCWTAAACAGMRSRGDASPLGEGSGDWENAEWMGCKMWMDYSAVQRVRLCSGQCTSSP
ncbi:hypothetical protein CALCODRAFT_284106 [Calocera cornea HHB12733]|uniref:Uncharacterized protein n=1 Tax=Calocera cornea HHB12733 TaxID=1353952 RepID=A0A165FYY6_9BASI|nr:hypothetical protein CALCODRAFT_284106 [Calocera cornea HHB12733]